MQPRTASSPAGHAVSHAVQPALLSEPDQNPVPQSMQSRSAAAVGWEGPSLAPGGQTVCGLHAFGSPPELKCPGGQGLHPV